jgi:hypothetical protein
VKGNDGGDSDDYHHFGHCLVEEVGDHLLAGGGELAIEMGSERMRFISNHSTMGGPAMRRLVFEGTSSGWVHHAVSRNTKRSR